jgi:hypothetical protein
VRRSRLPRWATSHTRRCWMRQAATCWRSRAASTEEVTVRDGPPGHRHALWMRRPPIPNATTILDD